MVVAPGGALCLTLPHPRMVSRQASTLAFLKTLSKQTGGRFHVFRGDLYDVPDDGQESLCDSSEVALVRNEVQMAGATLATVQALMVENEQRKKRHAAPGGAPAAGTPEGGRQAPAKAPASASEWLRDNSVERLKLTYYDALQPSVYRHASGDVDILEAGPDGLDEAHVPGAQHNSRVMHAELCKDLTLLRWRDGSMVSGPPLPLPKSLAHAPGCVRVACPVTAGGRAEGCLLERRFMPPRPCRPRHSDSVCPGARVCERVVEVELQAKG